MKKITFLLSILLCIQTFAGEHLFMQGNEEYANENYSVAISLYDSILINQMESSELYYNLANCYYKTQDWANAIWHYEKSLQIERNEKTLQNLELTKLKIIDRIEPIPQLFYKEWWDNLINLFSTKIWQILAILCIWITLIIRFVNYQKNYFSAFLNPLALILLFITYSSYEENYNKKEAIIFSSTTIANSAPTTTSINLFTLHAGSKVEIIDTIGEWINIKIANGDDGWIKESDCKIL